MKTKLVHPLRTHLPSVAALVVLIVYLVTTVIDGLNEVT